MLKFFASPLCQCKLRLEYTGGELADIRIGGEVVIVSCHEIFNMGSTLGHFVFFPGIRGVCWIGVEQVTSANSRSYQNSCDRSFQEQTNGLAFESLLDRRRSHQGHGGSSGDVFETVSVCVQTESRECAFVVDASGTGKAVLGRNSNQTSLLRQEYRKGIRSMQISVGIP